MFGPQGSILENAIQENYLQRGFIDPLVNRLGYRSISVKEDFPGRIGETITKTKMGLMEADTTPLDPATNSNIDNGLTPTPYQDEQYTLSVALYAQLAEPINLMDDEISIASFAMRNAANLGINLGTTVDRLARNALFNAYLSGNSFIDTAASSTTQAVDDIRGFTTAVVVSNTAGNRVQPVSVSNPLLVHVNGVANAVTGFTIDLVNTSTTALTGGISGTVTLSSSVSSTTGWSIISDFAPLIVRPGGRSTSAALQANDLLTMNTIQQAVAQLRDNNVPDRDGAYDMFVNAVSMRQLFQDPEFQVLQRGTSTRDPNYKNAWVSGEFLDVRFIRTTETFVQRAGAVNGSVTVAQGVQRPIICGGDSLIEGVFTKGLNAIKNMNSQNGVQSLEGRVNIQLLGAEYNQMGFYYNMRLPIDALAMNITQTASYVGGFVVPTDTTTTADIIPTANDAYYKRCVVIETAST